MKSKMLKIGACLQGIIILSFMLPQQSLAAYTKCPTVKFNDFSIFSQDENVIWVENAIGGGKVTDTFTTGGEYKQHLTYIDKSRKHILDSIQSAFYMNYSVNIWINSDNAKCTDRDIFIYGVSINEP